MVTRHPASPRRRSLAITTDELKSLRAPFIIN
jgi:hypothetical protein